MSRAAAGLLLFAAATIAAGAPVALDEPLRLVDPLGGGIESLSSGAPALHVVFFATWCPPCLDEMDRLAELEARWDRQGYRLVLVAVATRHTPERLQRFSGERRSPGRLLFDRDGEAQRRFGVQDVPTHLLLGADGREILRAARLDAGFEAEVARRVRAEPR